MKRIELSYAAWEAAVPPRKAPFLECSELFLPKLEEFLRAVRVREARS
ncbi:MAG TPA: hypothetical protein VK714_05215 [Myxococcota bacterium]|nr:hypothetical protein [Myxococcota bacterium]